MIWNVLVGIIIISMVMLYTPILFGGGSNGGNTSDPSPTDTIDLPEQTITIEEEDPSTEVTSDQDETTEASTNPESVAPLPDLEFQPF